MPSDNQRKSTGTTLQESAQASKTGDPDETPKATRQKVTKMRPKR